MLDLSCFTITTHDLADRCHLVTISLSEKHRGLDRGLDHGLDYGPKSVGLYDARMHDGGKTGFSSLSLSVCCLLHFCEYVTIYIN